ncbi:benzyl alcohol O-benzoyltransferase [Beta vulgaris subsp. vulgaris]|uniref:benzyl alcohol O-benzoyltransferase n=1 Tax=Beta vulgaris subsp. vulgaris TaxID=3555 RepID=UPI002036B33C|nr:benzyl alcohol O-benzoyltransferase [Beta vulgaris subsp. vulgaris]
MALMAQDTTPIVLNVTRGKPELVCPAEPTPRELKPLSDIDDQEGLRFHMPAIMFYRADPSMEEKDPVKVVKDALAKALVFYYPYAGRLVEGPTRKLSVDCTGEGVPFIEAEADARLEDFGDEIHPPFPLQDLLYDMPGTDGMLGTPLLIVQVTRLLCGGFIVALRANHAMSDGTGVMQFMNVVGEMGKGFVTPSILPVWDRERLTAKRSPNVSFSHPEYDQHEIDHHSNDEANLVQQSFLFGPTEIAALRRHISPRIKQFSTFDILSASLWRCRTIALGLDPEDEVRLLFAVNARSKFNPPLAKGYYGNACAFPAICAKAGDICQNKVEYILELIRNAKSEINEEYMRSIMDLMVTNDRPHFTVRQTYVVSDLRHLGFADVDFGWGKPVFGGPASNGSVPDASFFISFKNKKGETMTMVPISLPPVIMNVFVKELREMLKTQL